MAASRLSASLFAALLLLARAGFSLATDQDINGLFTTAAQQDASGDGQARDATIAKIRTEIRARMAADSATASALHFLGLLDEVQDEQKATRERLVKELQARAAKGDTTGLRSRLTALQKRYPGERLPSIKAVLDLLPAAPPPTASTDSAPRASAPSAATDTTPRDTRGATCPAGPPATELAAPALRAGDPNGDSAVLLTMRVTAPCPLASMELLLDSRVVRRIPVASDRHGTFELDDALQIRPGSHEIAFVACDTFGSCHRSAIGVEPVSHIPPWIPWTSAGVVVLGLLTGLVALFRRPRAPGVPRATPQGIVVRPTRPPATAATGKMDVSQSLRQIITDTEKDLPRGPRVVSRLATLPSIDGDVAGLESAFAALLHLPVARAGLRGTVLVATGRGPVSMEIVIEDNGPDIDDAPLRQLFDPACAKLRDRQGYDKELLGAADVVMRHHGHLSAEPRIDGGLRLRLRLPLPTATGPRATSLLK